MWFLVTTLYVLCTRDSGSPRQDYLIGSESHSLATVRGTKCFSSLQAGSTQMPSGRRWLSASSVFLFRYVPSILLQWEPVSSHSGTSFWSWDSLCLSPHPSSSTSFVTESLRGHPQILHVFILWIPGPTISSLQCGRRIDSFSSAYAVGMRRQEVWALTPPYPYDYAFQLHLGCQSLWWPTD